MSRINIRPYCFLLFPELTKVGVVFFSSYKQRKWRDICQAPGMFFCWFFTIIVTLILHYLWVKWNDGWNFPTWDDLVWLIMITHDMCWGDCPQYTYTCVYVCLFISMQGCLVLKTTGLWMVLGTWQSCMLANTHWAVPKRRNLFLRKCMSSLIIGMYSTYILNLAHTQPPVINHDLQAHYFGVVCACPVSSKFTFICERSILSVWDIGRF